MNGILRGLRQIFFIVALFVLSTITFTSCSVFRTLGLYNVPPPYSESYEEYHGRPLPHLNKAENISVHLSSDKKSYYPGEPITISCTIKNHSKTDTMAVNSPFRSMRPYLSIRSSSGKIIQYYGAVRSCSLNPAFSDEYGRQMNIYFDKRIVPNDEIEVIRRINRNYYNFRSEIFDNTSTNEILDRALDIQIKELIPDVYKFSCAVGHIEFDEIKGPKRVALYSDTLEIEIIKPTDKQMEQRNEYLQIMESIMALDDLDNIYLQGKTYANNFPDGFYLDKIKRIVLDKEKLSSLLGYLKKYKEKGAQ